MFGSEILEVAIGIIFVFLLVSVICSAIREGIETRLKSRAAYLEYGIRELLHDRTADGLAWSFYNHPLIYSLFSHEYARGRPDERPSILARGGQLPSYIPSRNFALALLDIAARGPATDAVSSDPFAPAITPESVRMNIYNLQSPAVQRVVLAALDSAEGDIKQVQASLEAWYDSAMDRVSGWYKRSTQWLILGIGLFVAVGLNVNTLTIAAYLYRNNTARANLVAIVEAEMAGRESATTTPAGATPADTVADPSARAALHQLRTLNLPIGWDDWRRVGTLEPGADGFFSILWYDWILAIPGWLITALAATMGAPFWFDVLNKVMVIRSTVKPHEKSPEEASEDRQLPQRRNLVLAGDALNRGGALRPGAARPRGVAPIPQPLERESSPPDDESTVDGCSIVFGEEAATPDEDLPASKGGVA